MKSNYFQGEKVYLRAVEPEDLEVLYTMENDPQLWDVSNFTVPYSRFAVRQYIENTQCDMFADQQLRLMIVHRELGVVLGTLDISEFVPLHGHGEVGVAIRSEYQGQGFAAEALQLLCDYALGFLRMKQLTVHIASDNIRSIRLFSSCGFVECGCLKQWWRVGDAYQDVLLMQLIRPDDARQREPSVHRAEHTGDPV